MMAYCCSYRFSDTDKSYKDYVQAVTSRITELLKGLDPKNKIQLKHGQAFANSAELTSLVSGLDMFFNKFVKDEISVCRI